MPTDLLVSLERLGLADVMLWLLGFALLYGLMTQAKVPQVRSARAIIAFVASILILIASPASLISTIQNIGTGLLVVLLGIMVLLVFIQAGGVKHFETVVTEVDEKGRPKKVEKNEVRLFSSHEPILVIVLLVLAVLIFLGAGGLNLANINLPVDPMGALFLGMLALAIFWLVTEGKGK